MTPRSLAAVGAFVLGRSLACAAALLFGAALLHAAPVQGQATAATISPEEAIISLQPYRMQKADLPAGYQPELPDARVPSVEAAGASSPVRALADYDRDGFIVGFDQTLNGDITATAPEATLTVYLMRDEAGAKAYTTDPARQPASGASSRVDPVSPGITAGDASVTWHLAITIRQGLSAGGYEVRWQRGRLVFVGITLSAYGQEQLGDVQALVAAIDKKAAAAGAPVVGAGTVAPAASESDRLRAALRLPSLLIKAGSVPAGYQVASQRYRHPADFVLRSASPRQTLTVLEQRYRRVLSVVQVLASRSGGTTTVLALEAALDADPRSALFDLSAAGDSALAIDPPLSLGDATVAYQDSELDSSGATTQLLDVYWLHGALILNTVLLQDAVRLDPKTIVPFMQQVEAAYQASAFAMPPAAPSDVRALAAGSTSVRVDWINPDNAADGYVILDADSRQVLATTGPNAVTATLSGLQPGGTYCVVVYGYGPGGSSDVSARACATTPG